MSAEHLLLSKEQAVREVVSYDDIPNEVLKKFLPLLEERKYPPGYQIIIEGDRVGKEVHFLAAGTVRVTQNPFGFGTPRLVAVLVPGNVFGEMAFINNEPRNATVTAEEEVTTYALPEANWHHLNAFYPGIAGRLKKITETRQEENLRRQQQEKPTQTP